MFLMFLLNEHKHCLQYLVLIKWILVCSFSCLHHNIQFKDSIIVCTSSLMRQFSIFNFYFLPLLFLSTGGTSTGAPVCFSQKIRNRFGDFCLRSGLHTRDPPLGPPSTLAEIFRHACLQSHLQTSPPTPQKSYSKVWNPRMTFENTPLVRP